MIDTGKHSRASTLGAMMAAPFLLAPALASADSGWEYTGNLYLWAPKITAETPGGAELELPFYKILDDLHMTFMGGIRAGKDKWSLSADLIYLSLDDDLNIEAGNEEAPANITGDVELKNWIVTPTVGYVVHESGKSRIEIYGGARYLDLKLEVDARSDGEPVLKGTESQDYWDGVIGARATINLDDRWFMPLSVDIGTGDSDQVWQGLAGIGYRFEKLRAVLAYRYLDYDFEKSDPALSELTIKGPLLGVVFNF